MEECLSHGLPKPSMPHSSTLIRAGYGRNRNMTPHPHPTSASKGELDEDARFREHPRGTPRSINQKSSTPSDELTSVPELALRERLKWTHLKKHDENFALRFIGQAEFELCSHVYE